MRKPADFKNLPLPMTPPPMYRGVVKHVVDGDTLDVFVDLGLYQYTYVTVRLDGVDTPEIFGAQAKTEKAAGMAAKARVEELVLNRAVLMRTFKDRTSFGRFVADIFYDDGGGNYLSLSETLVEEGYAKDAA
jgi:endonuclease YncB( thermonuclease family)